MENPMGFFGSKKVEKLQSYVGLTMVEREAQSDALLVLRVFLGGLRRLTHAHEEEAVYLD